MGLRKSLSFVDGVSSLVYGHRDEQYCIDKKLELKRDDVCESRSVGGDPGGTSHQSGPSWHSQDSSPGVLGNFDSGCRDQRSCRNISKYSAMEDGVNAVASGRRNDGRMLARGFASMSNLMDDRDGRSTGYRVNTTRIHTPSKTSNPFLKGGGSGDRMECMSSCCGLPKMSLYAKYPFGGRGSREMDRRGAPSTDSKNKSQNFLFWRVLVLLLLFGCWIFPGPEPTPAELYPRETLPTSVDSCADVLGVRKIALMFLLKGPLFHGDAWRKWLQDAHDAVPKHVLGASLCAGKSEIQGWSEDNAEPHSTLDFESIRQVCGPGGVSKKSTGTSQHLYNIYVHLKSDVDPEVLDPFWRLHMRNISRVLTRWGTHSLVEATRNLLWSAYRDPTNERFVLLSESDIPIWDPLTVYWVSMQEKRSYVDSWRHDSMNENRWTKKMKINKKYWRKSSQWFGLVRKHVQVILDDAKIFKAFENYCVYDWDFDSMKHRKCFSDEHYIPTLLSIHGLEDETVPFHATNTMVDWSQKGSAHPKSFESSEITSHLIAHELRSNSNCPISVQGQKDVQGLSKRAFVNLAQWNMGDGKMTNACQELTHPMESFWRSNNESILPTGCALFARKFEANTTEAVLQLITNCQSGLGMLSSC